MEANVCCVWCVGDILISVFRIFSVKKDVKIIILIYL